MHSNNIYSVTRNEDVPGGMAGLPIVKNYNSVSALAGDLQELVKNSE